ncbi:MAG: XRE family transcriptional regulator [Desulfarculus sp.]|jgi:transcriptional regulator with XRE-family HTH domain|nr:MAG: XRE family transcriptional regulator [Desulfarculus sp.]
MLPESEIGKNIRRIRRAKGFTLEALAKKSGISKGYLSKLENSGKAPPVSTLLNIAKALRVGISELFGEGLAGTRVSLVKQDERQLMARDGSVFGYAYETLAHKFPHKHMEPYLLTIPAKVKHHPFFQHKGEEMLLVVEGTMRFEVGGQEYVMEEGDCIYIDADIPHRGSALNCSQTKCLIVIFTP